MDEEEKDGLLIPTITTHGELDEFEPQNIEPAVRFKHRIVSIHCFPKWKR